MKKFLFVCLLTGLIIGLTACGGGEKSESNGDNANSNSTESNTVELKASNWEFDQETYTVPAGEVTVKLVNEDGFHGIDIEGTDISFQGEDSTTTTLEPGEYTIKCNIPCGQGHEEMTAQLVVE